MNEEQCNNFIASPLNIISKYLIQCFHVEPEVVSSFNTFQYNANENFTDGFRAPAKAKWLHHEEQFATDLENARQAGKNMVAKING
jgi:hypothetical protein